MKKYIIIITAVFFGLNFDTFAQISAPSNLEAEMEPGYAKVKWDDNSGNEDGFLVERALDSDSLEWEIVGQVGANAERFDDYWILFNRIFHYRVYAYNANGRSGNSNSDTVYTYGDTTNLPTPPTNLRVLKTTLTSITIRWDDNASNELGFIVARKRPEVPYFEFIDSVGTDVLTYQEVGLTPDNIYLYKVCAYNVHGISDYTNTVSARTEENTVVQTNSAPSENFYLRNNYPNPFNPSTAIEFGLSRKAFVRLSVFDISGRQIALLVNAELPQGTYSNIWNASGLTSGTYFYRLEAFYGANDYFVETKKMSLIK